MGRYDNITRRIAVSEALVASFLFAGERPSDLFGATFFDLREKMRAMKTDLEDKARSTLEGILRKDVTGQGFTVSELKVSLGKYRGSQFITSAKLIVVTGTETKARKLEEHLVAKYSPKYSLKNFDRSSGEAEYNVR